MIHWQDTLSIGILEIDIQHKLLFEKFNAFLAACEAQAESDAIYRLFWFVEAYAVTHFGQEEKMMEQAGYPALQGHRELHHEFSAEVARMKEVLRSEGPTPALVTRMKTFTSTWLIDHISNLDRAVGNYLNAAGAVAGA